MSPFRGWHVLLVLLPVIGWWLLAAYGLDAWRGRSASQAVAAPSSHGTPPDLLLRGRRLAAGAIDLAPLLIAAATLPPAFAWILGSGYLLFRDAGPRPIGLGKRFMGLEIGRAQAATLSYRESFDRNLPLLLPYLGPLIEAALILAGRRRLGDRLATAEVRRAPA